jgi:uncharacterized protein YlxP (DUF503 family)
VPAVGAASVAMGSGGFVAVLVIELHFPEVGSLKGKRHELSSVKALLQRRFAVAVAETDHQDLWQRATLTAALTGGSFSTLSSAVDNVERWLLGRFPDDVRIERLVASVEDLRG